MTGVSGPAVAKTEQVLIQDPHGAPAESEVIRTRRLTGFWRYALLVASAATIFLCLNQQFVLRFFIGFTPLNTEYYYGLVLLMMPFVFIVFPGMKRQRLIVLHGTTSCFLGSRLRYRPC